MPTFMHTPTSTVAISKQERSFIVAFGERVAALRKERGLTQVQLADLLGTSQQTVTAYENGTRRVPITTLPLLAHTLGTSIEELIGGDARRNAKRGPSPKIQQQLERVSQLPRARQRMVSEVLDSLLAQAR
ncbi:MAG TPA: helix-turn-helix transcriptional regulator [Rhodanobacteraceae bacterium]|nr:helix-turn-helix transcriptional regulator [Rhodanobacteraceae bacterium]